MFGTDVDDQPELYLPEQGVACSVESYLTPVPLRLTPVAKAWLDPEIQNNVYRQGGFKKSEVSRVNIPAGLAGQLVELARLRRQADELGTEIARQLVELVPLDSHTEFEAFAKGLAAAREQGIAASLIAPLQESHDRIMDGTITDDPVGRLRELRGKLAALMPKHNGADPRRRSKK